MALMMKILTDGDLKDLAASLGMNNNGRTPSKIIVGDFNSRKEMHFERGVPSEINFGGIKIRQASSSPINKSLSKGDMDRIKKDK